MTEDLKPVTTENQPTGPGHFWNSVDDVVEFCRSNAGEIDYEGAFPIEEFRRIAEAGLLAAPVGRREGGLGFGVEPGYGWHLLRLLKRLGYGNLTVGRLFEGHANAIQLIRTYGSAEQVLRFSREVVDDRLIFGVWNTEMSDGVTITPTADGRYRLDGSKTFASGAGSIQRPLVTGALPDGGWQMFVVPADQFEASVDESWWKPLGMRSSATFKIDFTGIELSPDDLIGQPGDYHRPPWFTGGAIRFAAVQHGGTEALLDETRWFLQRVQRTEDPFQQQRIGLMQIASESGEQWLRNASVTLEGALNANDDDQFQQIMTYAGMTRTAIEQIALDMIRWSQQSVGARGLARPEPFERLIRDLTMYLRQPAPDATLVGIGRYSLSHECRGDEIWSRKDGDCS